MPKLRGKLFILLDLILIFGILGVFVLLDQNKDVEQVRAASFTVTNTNDSGAGSLRQAIADASGNSAPDLINFNIPKSDLGCVDPDGGASTSRINGMIADSVVSSASYDVLGRASHIITVNPNILAIVYETSGAANGAVKTAQLDNNGNITGFVDSLVLETQRMIMPQIFKVGDGYYGAAYDGNGGYMLRTFSIDASGNISNSIIDSYEFSSDTGARLRVAHVVNDIYLFQTASQTSLRTFRVSATGIITKSIIDTQIMSQGGGGDMYKISDTKYIVSYRGADSDGFFQTYTVNSVGNISGPNDTYEFDTTYGYRADIVHVSGNVFMAAYNTSVGGYHQRVITFSVDGSGNISNLIDTFDIDNDSGGEMEVRALGNNYFAVIYHLWTNPGTGVLLTVQISDSGTITKSIIDQLNYDNDHDSYMFGVDKVTETLYAISHKKGGILFGGGPDDGHLTIVRFETSSACEDGVNDNTGDEYWEIKPSSLLTFNGFSGVDTIDGYTQTGAQANTNAGGALNTILKISLDGNGLRIIGGAQVIIKGLNIHSASTGITVSGASTSNNIIEGNFIGTDITGTVAKPNTGDGVSVGGTNNTIGGGGPAERNLISGNTFDGIQIISDPNNTIQGNLIGSSITGNNPIPNGSRGIMVHSSTGNNLIGGVTGTTPGGACTGDCNLIVSNGSDGIYLNSSDGNFIQGNFIGVNISGTAQLPNSGDGVYFNNAENNTVGGGGPVGRNLISSNTGLGIQVRADNNIIQGNFIGTDTSGTLNLGNLSGGIRLIQSASDNTIGGTVSNDGNVIAFNQTYGIELIQSAVRNNIQRNSIFGNNGLGIDLQGNGVSANDLGDGDTGSNNQQNFPVITSVVSDGVDSQIIGTLNSIADSNFTLEFYNNPSGGDPSGNGEGEVFLGETAVLTNSSGDVNFNVIFNVPVNAGDRVAGTATDSTNNSSEFSIAGVASVGPISSGPTISGDLITESGGDMQVEDILVNTSPSGGVFESIDLRVNGTSWIVMNPTFNNNVSDLGVGAIINYSDSDNHGRLGGGNAANAPTWTSSGIYGGAYDFDGTNDYIRFPSHASLDIKDEITVEFWIRLKDQSGDTDRLVIKEWTSDSNPWFLWGFSRVPGTRKISFKVVTHDGTNNNLTTALDALALDAWTHVVGTYAHDGAQKIYIDGVKTDERVGAPTPINQKNTSIAIGGNVLGNREYSKAIYDEVKIYDRSLSLAQVQKNFAVGVFNHKRVAKEETFMGDQWQAYITPTNLTSEGPVHQTNILDDSNTAPVVNPILATESGGDLNFEDTILTPNESDVDSDAIVYSHQWEVDGNPLTRINLTFNKKSNSLVAGDVKDHSGHNNHGQLGGGDILKAPFWFRNGIHGGAYSFNGYSDYIRVPSDSSLDVRHELTLEFWIYLRDQSGDADRLVTKEWTSDSNPWFLWGFSRVPGTRKISFKVVTDDGANNTLSTATDVLVLNDWTHVVGTYKQDGTQKIFVNGSKVAEGNGIPTPIKQLNTPFTIGGNLLGNREYANAAFDEVKVYDRALKQQQILRNYNNGNFRFDWISKEETFPGDIWKITLKPSDLKDEGTSQIYTLNDNNTVPNISPALATAGGGDMNVQDIVQNSSENDVNNDLVHQVINWFVDGSSITALNFPWNERINTLSAGGIPDYSGNDNHGQLGNGTLEKAPNWTSEGKFKGAYSFNGYSDYIRVPSDPSLDFIDEISIEFWIYLRDQSGDTDRLVIKEWTSDSSPWFLWGFSRVPGTRKISFNVVTNDGTSNILSTSNDVLILNDWTHVVGTYEQDGAQKIYIDGVEVASRVGIPTPIKQVDTPVAIGGNVLGNREYANAIFDEVRIYNRALTSQQINLNYGNGTTFNQTLVTEETFIDDVWYTETTATDFRGSSSTSTSNLLDDNNTAPSSTGNVTTEFGGPVGSEDLIMNTTPSDPEGDSIFENVVWKVDGNSIVRAEYPFNIRENSEAINKIIDISGNDNHGQLGGGDILKTPFWVKDGAYGGAYSFNGYSDFIRIPSDPSLDITNALTVEFWIYLRDQSGDSDRLVIKEWTSDSSPWFLWGMNRIPGTRRIGFTVVTGTNTANILTTTGDVLALNGWTHVVGTYASNGDQNVYIDGVLSAQRTGNPTPIATRNTFLTMGGNVLGNREYANMRLDEVKIYDRALTAEQVAINYNNGNFESKRIAANMTQLGETWTADVYPADLAGQGSFTLGAGPQPPDFGNYNIYGFSWSELIGWTSHNANDSGSSVDYGVNIESDFRLVGYAWSENYGWIQYDPPGPYPYGYQNSAIFNPCLNKLFGWIKILALGDNGWVSLRNYPGDVIEYGVDVDYSGGGGIGEFKGYAWSESLGWIDYDPLFGGVLTNFNSVCPGNQYNVRGFAWNDNYGWISHNALDIGSFLDFGVNLEIDGTLTGFAWSDNLGWVEYNPAGPYPASPDYSAKYDACSNEVSGWIKATSLGDDGWISLNSTGGIFYGVTLDAGTGNFLGYSWGNIIGWTQYDPPNGGVYTTSINLQSDPKIPELVKPIGNKETWFDYPEFRNAPLLPTLTWSDFENENCVAGVIQKSYQVQLASDTGFSNIIYDQTVLSQSNSHALQSSLSYNQTYYWRVKVTNTLDRSSEFGVSGGGGESNSFRTPLHKAPDADFFTQPALVDINANKDIQFFDQSTSYGGSTIVYWRWDFGDGTVLQGTDPALFQNPKHKYKGEGLFTITLLVRDSDGYEGSKVIPNVEVKLPLPEFRRTIPR